jgi:hypothetical protein
MIKNKLLAEQSRKTFVHFSETFVELVVKKKIITTKDLR